MCHCVPRLFEGRANARGYAALYTAGTWGLGARGGGGGGGGWNGLFSLLGRGPLNGSLVERWEDGASDSRKSFADVTPGNRVSGEQR